MANELVGRYRELAQSKYAKVRFAQPRHLRILNALFMQFLVTKLLKYWYVFPSISEAHVLALRLQSFLFKS